MKTKIEITDKKIVKNIEKQKYYSLEAFTTDSNMYLKAIAENRMMCCIKKVSASGMSRNLKFNSCEKGTHPSRKYYYRRYNSFFIAMGYAEVKDSDSFRIGGCGMDMVFHTNYTIIHKLHRLGFINKAQCDKLCQMTPTVL